MLLALVTAGCRKRESTEPALAHACKAACATLSEADCFPNQDHAVAQAACVRACEDSGAQSRVAGCASQHLAYLGCVAANSGGCAGAKTPRGALDVELALDSCAAEARSYRACVAACAERGVVHTRSTRLDSPAGPREVQAEIVGLGCAGATPAPPSKAPSGSPCSHYSVCSAAVCDCPNARARYQARACVDGRCAAASLVCSLAAQAAGTDACGQADGR